jgi:hypothetical protein
MLRRLLWFLFMSAALLAQTAPAASASKSSKDHAVATRSPDRATQKEMARWMERARYWTDAALEEEWRLEPDQRTLFHARLAQLWWKADARRASGWLQGALRDAGDIPPNETEASREKRLASARLLFGFVGEFDLASRQRLLDTLLDSVKRAGGPYKSASAAQTVDWLGDTARDLLQSDPPAAGHLFEKMLPYANGNFLQAWLPDLYFSAPDLAPDLHRKAIAAALASRNPDLAFGLLEAVDPVFGGPDRPQVPAELRSATLAAAARIFVARQQDAPAEACMLAPDLIRMASGVPDELAPRVQVGVAQCEQNGPGGQKREVALQQKQLKTADDYLNAADAATDVAERALFKSRAMIMLEKSDPARALDIAESFTEEEAKANHDGVNLRPNIIHRAIGQLVKEKDYQALQRVIDRQGHDWRLAVLVEAAQASRPADQSFARLMYGEARRELADTTVRDPHLLMAVLQLASSLAPEEESAVLREICAAINAMPADDPKGPGIHFLPLWYSFGPMNTPPGIADLDDGSLKATIDTLKAPQYRVAFRLSLTRASLIRRDALLPPAKR